MIDIANYCELVKMRNIHHTELARCTVLIDYARIPDGYSPVRFRTENGVICKAIKFKFQILFEHSSEFGSYCSP